MELPDYITTLYADFIDPKKRVFIGYLLLSLLIAFAWMIALRRTPLRESLAKIFDRKVFFSPSAKADYKIFIINRLFSFFISPLLLTQLAIATSIYYLLHRQGFVHSGQFSDVSKPLIVGLYSVTLFLVEDLTKYLVHRWMHRWPLFWAIHKIHHSAETMTPITVYRVHPLEGVLYGLRGTFSQGLVISAFVFAFGSGVDLYTIVGVNVLVFFFHVTGSNLRHSHIAIRYWPWLEHILISPSQHQLHHSIAREHHDKNFGVALAVWDWMFGSLHLSETDKDLTFGLTGKDKEAARLSHIYFYPILDMGRVIRRRLQRLKTFVVTRVMRRTDG